METESFVDDTVEVVKVLDLQVLDIVRADGGIDGGELLAELGHVRRVACDFIDDMRQCGSSGITVRICSYSVTAVDWAQRVRWGSGVEDKTNLPATTISCASPSSILSSVPLGFAPSYGFNKADMMSGVDAPFCTKIR